MEISFGHSLKDKFYQSDYTNFNHGSFGATPKSVLEEQFRFQILMETHPDKWFRDTIFKQQQQCRQMLANLINADVQDVVFVENASSAVNSILRTFNFKKNDQILILQNAYNMVIETLNWLKQTIGIEIVIVQFDYPLLDDQVIIDEVSKSLKENLNIKMCIFCHISSMPTMIEPVKILTQMCHDAGSKVFIDGAHAPGNLDIDVKDIGADFYTGNCHKWLYAPKGCAFLHVANSQEFNNQIYPTVISSTGYQDFIGKYAYTGTRDYTSFAVFEKALQFQQSLGGQKIIVSYLKNLAAEAGKFLAESWGTQLLVSEKLCSSMINVILPSKDQEKIKEIQKILDEQYKIYIIYSKVNQRGEDIFFVRISAAIYIELDDFKLLAKLVPELLNQKIL